MPKLIGEKPMTGAERSRRWRENNPERAREVQRKHRENNPGSSTAASRRYYAKNAENEKARSLEWRKRNPEAWKRIYTSSVEKRRALKSGANAFLILPREIEQLYSRPCSECGSMKNQTIDHIVPLSRGGRHSVGNLQTLCSPCNSSKNRKLLIEWRARKRLSRVKD